MDETLTEEERVKAMFEHSEQFWQATEKVMQHQRPVFRPRPQNFQQPKTQYQGRGQQAYDDMPVRPPPAGYICYRCGQRGHYISFCPTLGDSEFDKKPLLKRTTGIPKMFLRTVDKSEASGGVMVTESGEFVVARPNEVEWNRFEKRRKVERDVPDHLKCGICDRLFEDPVTVPCCKKVYCDECECLYCL